MGRDDAHVLDMLIAARRVEEATRGRSLEEFGADWQLQSAVQHQLMILGEAVKRLSAEFREQHTQFPWQAMAGHRDILIHQYDAVDLAEVWRIATEELPSLTRFLESIVPKEGDGR